MYKIINGRVYDPVHGIDGERKTIYIKDGSIVEGPFEGAEVIDAQGMVVMPGGVEVHSHIAGPKVNVGRQMCPEDHYVGVEPRTDITRAGCGQVVPTTYVTGYRYARMGYTTAFEAATPPLEARHVHEELNDIPMLDKGCYVLMGNNHFVLRAIKNGDRQGLKDYIAWLLLATKGYAIKVVNPGGVVNWKLNGNATTLDEEAKGYGVTPREIVSHLVQANEELGLPHPVHIHCNNLGQPGNYRTTLETLKEVEGQRMHLTHLQFHSYGASKRGRIVSKAPEIAEYLNTHPKITADAGQVVFGPVTTMTADGALQHQLHLMTGSKWGNTDIEMETGSGVVPMMYKKSSLANSVQWAIGLELLLTVENPWQIFLTTDHPNAGPFTAYPSIIKLLMDRDYREEMLSQMNKKTSKYTTLAGIKREYTLSEIAVITRSGPARVLGLKKKGHLGAGADADVAIYPMLEDKEEMFANPTYVFKGGKLVVRSGKIIEQVFGATHYVDAPWNKDLLERIADDFQRFYTVSMSNYPVQPEYLPVSEVVSCS
ncbi:MAG: formylmethanofuran dehydrogenase subunit A [Syntrophaceticus sp.]|jgi:formylmethanofuran dehydrogenase subunit A